MENTLDPEWQTSFTLDYYFHQTQNLRFVIYDIDDDSGDLSSQDPLGTAECRLGQVVAAPGHQKELFLSPHKTEPGDCGIISVRAEEHADGTRDRVTLDLTAQSLDKKDLFSESDPFYIIYRRNPDGSETLVYRSEWILDTASPDWKPVTLDCAKLCLGDWNRDLRIEVYDWDADGGHDFIGDCTTTLEELAQGEGFQIIQFDLINAKKKEKKGYKNSGQIVVKAVKIEQDSTFLDYVRGGMKVNMVCALDMSKSSAGLHRLRKGDNAFTTAIRTVAEILQDYDHDKQVLGLVFGTNREGNIHHCFPLNGNVYQPNCEGVEGLLRNYKENLDTVEMAEPTNFSEVLNYVVDDAAKRKSEADYTVIMIITDGGISDMAETKAALVALSRKPVSVVLVGVGDGDMRAMIQLDSDKARLHSKGDQAARDIVQFVHLNTYLPCGSLDPADFQHELEAPRARLSLARAVLQEIPRQVVEYMRSAGISPKVPDIPDIPDDTLEEDFDKRFNM